MQPVLFWWSVVKFLALTMLFLFLFKFITNFTSEIRFEHWKWYSTALDWLKHSKYISCTELYLYHTSFFFFRIIFDKYILNQKVLIFVNCFFRAIFWYFVILCILTLLDYCTKLLNEKQRLRRKNFFFS